MYVEVVVTGALGELAASAFPEFVVERRQIFVTSETDAVRALERLTERNVNVVVLRLRPNQRDLD